MCVRVIYHVVRFFEIILRQVQYARSRAMSSHMVGTVSRDAILRMEGGLLFECWHFGLLRFRYNTVSVER